LHQYDPKQLLKYRTAEYIVLPILSMAKSKEILQMQVSYPVSGGKVARFERLLLCFFAWQISSM